LTILVCFLQGFASEQTGLLTAGLFIFVIFLLSFVLIQNRKMREWKDSFANGQELGGLSHDMTQFLGGGTGYLLSKVSNYYIAMLLVFLVLLFIVYATGSISSNNFSYAMTMLAFILVPISITIRLYVDYPNDKKMPQPSPSKSTTVEGSVLNP
jgi:preprotein translocase subunit SecG